MSLFDSAVASGIPAPFWFVELFKILGFALHLIPMGLLLVGIPFSALLWLFGGVNSKRLAQRLFQQAPVFMALAINLGIVPLLFVQLAYSKLFYTTTIIIAAHWIAILPLAFFAYLACYLCAGGARKEKVWSTVLYACLASFFLFGVGLVFSDVWTLFERPYELEGLRETSALSFDVLGVHISLGGSGTANGLALYWGNPTPIADPVVFLRFAGILGLAFYALGFWIVFDAFYVYRGPRPLSEEESYRLMEAEDEQKNSSSKSKRRRRLPIQEDQTVYPKKVISIACFLIFMGILVETPSFIEYVMRRLRFVSDSVPNVLVWNVLVWGTWTTLVLPFLFLVLGSFNKLKGKTLAFLLTLCELALVGFYATLRQTIQTVQLSPYYKARDFVTADGMEISPILAFLGVFVLVLVWIIALIVLMAKSGDGAKAVAKRSKQKKVKKSKKNRDEEVSRGKASDLTIATRPASYTPSPKKGQNPNSGKSFR